VRSDRSEPIDDGWDSIGAAIMLDPEVVGTTATRGLESFSHVDVVYCFHLVDEQSVATGARRPRGNPDWPAVGILAQRAKDRPNRIGVSTCRLLAVEGLELHIGGLDAIDGTPVLDVKPHMRGFGPRGPVSEPAWARELMAGYW
jgi:tRNA (Thr-GGU) A37 N-methylase